MDQKRIVIDTNTLISAFGWKGNPRKVLQSAIKNKSILFISPQTFDEFIKVLDYPKFDFPEHRKTRFKDFLLAISEITIPATKINLVKEDPKDNMFLECAQSCKAHYLITGDKHLLKLKIFKGTKIVKAKEFLEKTK